MPERQIHVGTGEGRVTREPCILESIGIGSCIAICLYDRKRKIAGMAHVLLGHNPGTDLNPMRFADTAIDALLRKMMEMGSKKEDIEAKIFGGAELFRSKFFKVGEENVLSVKEKLRLEGIRIVAEDTGGHQGRNIWFDTTNGKVVVGKIFGPTKEY
ncbi:MAG TPA: chemotaxis protein CheD [Candidatus Altiarchaeales archaeon]|nr:MAG: chemotaxis protein CheD [Candidatus Altiarchaeales archaeon ex4484_43]HDH41367.1 chemotaxis protein CheD [Candidatus Altiarchaeales archaeon]